MSKTKIELNSAAVRQLLKSSEMEAGIGALASGIASRAGEGYASDTRQMPTRVIASAYTDSTQAMEDSAENNTLLKVMKG